MSNKIVPSIYRTVIDDVIASIRPAFGEFGVPEDVLSELQSKWESKIVASRVADFDSRFEEAPPPTMPTARQIVYPHPTLPALAAPLQNQNQNQSQSQTCAIPYVPPHVKPEGPVFSFYSSSYSTSASYSVASFPASAAARPQGHEGGGTYVTGIVDARYGLAASTPAQYAAHYASQHTSQYASSQSGRQYASQYQPASSQHTLPALAGPSVPALPTYPSVPQPRFNLNGTYSPPPTTRTATPISVYRIPQTDGAIPEPWSCDDAEENGGETEEGDDDVDNATPLVPIPRATHPSLLATPTKNARTVTADLNEDEVEGDEDAITSDLDDSDSDSDSSSRSLPSSRSTPHAKEETRRGNTDMVFCTYTKVARVKTKWRCVLREGVIHVGGKRLGV
ncbi:Transcription factor IIA, alpha/beta subunit [Mycena sanguinolenta]|uniref:Transcription factor IIA, alpha/beta subunit n=1 Tax=Mycena sanguinolenta TaxID=230812 RepID=A0A8H6Z8J9_9AGAR|nr:Transcription factor IIA, alpha/beta subunit [Mycena sanguinolenta]